MPGPVFMRGERVTLHPVEADDLEFLQELVNHPDVRPGIGATDPMSLEDEREWFESRDDDPKFLVGSDGDRVGTIGFSDRSEKWGTAEVGYFLHPDAWGDGYATDALARVVEYGFEELRLARVRASVFDFNDASRRVLEKVGFTREGTMREGAFIRGERVDVHKYGLLADEWAGAGAGTDSAARGDR